jgi:hypothetical protein
MGKTSKMAKQVTQYHCIDGPEEEQTKIDDVGTVVGRLG